MSVWSIKITPNAVTRAIKSVACLVLSNSSGEASGSKYGRAPVGGGDGNDQFKGNGSPWARMERTSPRRTALRCGWATGNRRSPNTSNCLN